MGTPGETVAPTFPPTDLPTFPVVAASECGRNPVRATRPGDGKDVSVSGALTAPAGYAAALFLTPSGVFITQNSSPSRRTASANFS